MLELGVVLLCLALELELSLGPLKEQHILFITEPQSPSSFVLFCFLNHCVLEKLGSVALRVYIRVIT